MKGNRGKKTSLYPIIAGHFKGAGDKEKAAIYNKKSAFDALNRYDNLTAMRFLEEVCEGGVGKENIECGFSLVEVYGNLGRAKEEMELISKIEEIEDELDTKEKLRFLSFETKKAIMERDAEKAEELFQLSEKLAQENNEASALAKIYVNQAGGLYGPRGELDTAKASLDKCLALPDSKETAVFKVTALFNNGIILQQEGKNEESLKCFQKAYRKAARLKLLPQMAAVAENVAQMFYAKGQYKTALDWIKRAGKYAETFGHRQLLLFNNLLQSIIEHTLGEGDKAKERLLKNVEKSRRFNNPYVSALTLQALIDVNYSLLDTNNSISCGINSLKLFGELRNSITFRETLIEFLKVFYSLNERATALNVLKENKYDEFLKKNRSNPPIDGLLGQLLGCLNGKKIEYGCRILLELLERLKPDYLFLCLEESSRSGGTRSANEIIEKILSDNIILADVSLKVKLFLFLSLLKDERAKLFEKEVSRRLIDNPFGGYGLRALAILWQKEKSPSKQRKLRRLFISRLYYFKTNSPKWAFEKMLEFEEIKKIFLG